MKKYIDLFWGWYKKHLFFNTALAAGLFTLQLVHLYWLTTHVVFMRLFGKSWFDPSGGIELLILLVDYTEIPAIIATSLVYLHDLRNGYKFKPLLYLLFLNSQWIHIFWITDEFVLDTLTGSSVIGIPSGLAWVAIGIDYLELPVIFDTLRKLPRLMFERSEN